MSNLQLENLITFNPSAILVDTTLDELMERFGAAGFHHWPVVDDDRMLLGLVSDLDLVRVIEERHGAALAIAGGVPGPSVMTSPRVSDFMIRSPITIDEKATPREVLSLMIEQKLYALPVVREGRLIGMVTSTDFLREFSFGACAASRELVQSRLVVTPETIDVESTIDEAKMICDLQDHHSIPVTKGEFPLGVVSRRDLRKAKCREAAREIYGPRDWGPTTLAELIQQAPSIRPGNRLGEAAAQMVERGVQGVAVVNAARRLMGIITDRQILAALLEELSQ
jgi:CBS domain-containing protein